MLRKLGSTLTDWAFLVVFTVAFIICDGIDRLYGVKSEDSDDLQD